MTNIHGWLLMGIGVTTSCWPEPRQIDAPTEVPACGTWCRHARELGCLAGKPTKGGASCEDVCNNVQTSGFATYDLECRSKAASCDVADQCERDGGK